MLSPEIRGQCDFFGLSWLLMYIKPTTDTEMNDSGVETTWTVSTSVVLFCFLKKAVRVHITGVRGDCGRHTRYCSSRMFGSFSSLPSLACWQILIWLFNGKLHVQSVKCLGTFNHMLMSFRNQIAAHWLKTSDMCDIWGEKWSETHNEAV